MSAFPFMRPEDIACGYDVCTFFATNRQIGYACLAERMMSRGDIKEIVQALAGFGLLCAWFAWAALVFCLGLAGDSMRFFANWFWLGIGQWLFKLGVPKDVLLAQFMVSWIIIVMFLMVGPLFVWMRFGRAKGGSHHSRENERHAHLG